jgi:hypothetical protein
MLGSTKTSLVEKVVSQGLLDRGHKRTILISTGRLASLEVAVDATDICLFLAPRPT